MWRHNRFHAGLIVYTAAMVAVTDFLIGVLSALVGYETLKRFLDRPGSPVAPVALPPAPVAGLRGPVR